MKRLWITLVCALFLHLPSRATGQTPLPAQQGTVVTTALAGGGLDPGEGVFAWQAAFRELNGVALDAAENVYVSERNRVRKVGIDGVVTTVAGTGDDGDAGDGGAALKASLFVPAGMAFGPDGSLYICDSNNNRVRKVDPNGVITTVAGTGARGLAGDNGQAARAALSLPTDIALDAAGNLYIADSGNSRVRRVARDGVITTFAGGGSGTLTDGMQASQAPLGGANAVAVDGSGNVYVTNGSRVYKIDTSGTIRLIAGGGVRAPSAGAQATTAQLVVTDLAVDANGAVYAGFTSAGVVKVGTDGLITILPATGINNYKGIAVDGEGAVYVTDQTGKVYRIASTPRKRPEGSHLRVAVRSLPFDVTVLNNTAQRRLLLLSAGSAALSISGITATGENASEFSATPTQASVGSGDTVSVTVAFKPTSAGVKRATLSIAHNGQGSPFTLPLTGVGVQPPGGAVTISTVAGTGKAGFGGDGGPGAFADVNAPQGIALGPDGSVYFADTQNHRIRKIGRDGVITTIAGGAGVINTGDGGKATQATLGTVGGIAVDAHGVLYLAADDRVRRIGLDGVITSVAGGGSALGDGGDPLKAQVRASGIAVDANGVLYLTEKFTHRVRRVGPPVEAVKGPGVRLSGEALAFDVVEVGKTLQKTVSISNPGNEPLAISGITVDGADAALFTVTPTSGTVAAGQSLTLTVTFAPTSAGSKSASLSVAHNAAAGPSRVALSGFGKGAATEAAYTISTLAGVGGGEGGFGGDGGPATQAQFNTPSDVAVDAKGNVYVADTINNRVRRIAPDGTITTFAGGGTGQPGAGSGGPATQAVLIGPSQVALDASGNVLIADPGGQRVARVGADGTLRTIAGGTSLVGGFAGDGGPATAARLNMPRGVAADAKGNVYFIDQLNNRVRKVSPEGTITTLAGTGTAGFSGDGGPAALAQIRPGAGDLAVDASGNLYIADQLNNRIRKVDANGTITTVAGGGTDTKDGIPATQARIEFVSGVAVGPDGSLFITDTARIRRVGPDGFITTIAGTGQTGFSGDGGPALQAQIFRPGGLDVDAKGNVFIADTRNNRIRKLTPSGGTPPGGDRRREGAPRSPRLPRV